MMTDGRVEVGETELDWIARSLGLDGIGATPGRIERLGQLVAGSMATFRQEQAAARTHRAMHNALHRLWQLAQADDPQIGVIRIVIARLSAEARRGIEERARIHWPTIFRTGFPSEGFVAWSRGASAAELLEALQSFIADGGARVPGRTRPRGRRSRTRFEPRILGQVRGADLGRDTDAPTAGVGRPHASAADTLVMHLAIDWLTATEQTPEPGRSDQTGFGALVHHVFGWLGLGAADQALRRYWTEVGSALITPIEGGEEWR